MTPEREEDLRKLQAQTDEAEALVADLQDQIDDVAAAIGRMERVAKAWAAPVAGTIQ